MSPKIFNYSTPVLAVFAIAAMAGVSSRAAPASSAPPPAFANCVACHSVSADGRSGMGPNLRGIIGRKAGTAKGFTGYSAAMKRSNITWSPAELNAFLAAPAKRVPNNAMPYPGTSDPAKRAAIVKYLQTLR